MAEGCTAERRWVAGCKAEGCKVEGCKTKGCKATSSRLQGNKQQAAGSGLHGYGESAAR
jgi:hypothetical protein